jgi:thiosulfate/3-mercaptopyruvate sulfurtransferase
MAAGFGKVFVKHMAAALLAALLWTCAWASTAQAATGTPLPLISAEALRTQLGRPDLVLLDASPPPLHARAHIAGAVAVDVFTFGARTATPAQMQELFRAWGIHQDSTVVIYDQGASYFAPRVFFDLYTLGFPVERLFVLDGGLARWQATGGATTTEPTAARKPGNFTLGPVREQDRSTLQAVLAASGDPQRQALVDALDTDYYFGGAKFFDRGGHLPLAISLPTADLFNPDSTFKSPPELRRLLTFLGIRPEQQIHTYCGGGLAAAAPYFAIKFVAGYPQVSLFRGSQHEWVRDDRVLPLRSYPQPQLLRDAAWLAGWNQPMLRMFGVAGINIVDVRPRAAYDAGHIPFALSVPAAVWRAHLTSPAALAQLAEQLGVGGVDPTLETVIVSERGLDADAALAFVLLERLGQARTSVLSVGLEDWAMGGQPLARAPTVVGRPASREQLAVPPAVFRAALRQQVVDSADDAPPAFARVTWWAGAASAANAPAGAVRVPVATLFDKDGRLLPAAALWPLLNKAGLPRYARIVTAANDPADAALAYLVLRLLGHPDARVALQ